MSKVRSVAVLLVLLFASACGSGDKSDITASSGATPIPPNDTEILGQSQTEQWFPHFTLNRWQARIQTGSGYMNWRDPTHPIWTNPVTPGADGVVNSYGQIERVILTIGRSPEETGTQGTYESLVDETIATIRTKYLNLKEILLQPLAAGPNRILCTAPNNKTGAIETVATTKNLPAIEDAITTLVAKHPDVKAGLVPLVADCKEFMDSTGHLTDVGRVDIAKQHEDFYSTGAGSTGISGPIGFIGCSMSNNAVGGYTATGGTLFWPVQEGYSGGGVGKWAGDLGSNSVYWNAFQGAYDLAPAKAIWWQLCALDSDSANETLSAVQKVYDEIKRRAPEAIVFISAQPAYTNGHVCSIAGSTGPERMQSLADQFVTTQQVLRGPVMEPLQLDMLSDGCHANSAGSAFMGQQLMEFFGQ